MPTTFTDDRVIHFVPTRVQLGYNDEEATPAIQYIDLDSNAVSLDEQFTTLVTQGTVTTYEKDLLEKMFVNIENQVWQAAYNEIMLGTATTAGLSAGETKRTGYDGQYRSRFYELRVTMTGTDQDSGADRSFVVVLWKLSPKQYRPFNGLNARQVVQQTAQFSVLPAKVDLLNAPIVGLKNSATGDYYTIIEKAVA